MARHGFDPERVQATPLPDETALAAARAGLGLHVEHRPLITADLAEGRLIAVFEGEDDPGSLGYYLVTRPGPQRAALKTFLRWIRTQS